MNLSKKKELIQKRRWRIRKKVKGTAERPRVTVRFSNKNIHAQCIDDIKAHTMTSLSSNFAEFKDVLPNLEGSKKLGSAFGSKIKEVGVNTIVFDRAGRKYHGCVKAFADALREQKLEF